MKKDLGKKVMNKGAGLFLAVFSCVSMFGVGFASWAYGDGVSSNAEAAANLTIANSYSLLTLSNKSGNGRVCKYGFLNDENQIASTCNYTYTYSLNQASARSLLYIQNNSASFRISISDKSGSNSFVSLFYKGYYSATASITYNSVATSPVAMTATSSSLSASIALSSMTQNDTQNLSLSLVFSFDSSKQSVLETYLKTVNQSLGFDFTATLGME